MNERVGERGFGIYFVPKTNNETKYPIDSAGELSIDSLREPLDAKKLAQLAKKIYRNEIFTSMQIPEYDVARMLVSIFMPLGLMDEVMLMKLRKGNYAHCYGYIGDCMPMSVNGYPIFSNVYMLTSEEARIVLEKHQQILDVMSALEDD